MNQTTIAKRVLVAEDDVVTASLIKSLLSGQGYQVELTADGQECLERIQSFQPALIILDIMLPKIPGTEVLKILKASPDTSKIGVLVCTAKNYKSDHDDAKALGAFGVLPKPFEKEGLIKAVGDFFNNEATTKAAPKPTLPEDVYLPKIRTDVPYFRIWGSRGSIPVSGQKHVRHGGNTSCLEVTMGDESIIFDAGTGMRELGLALAKRGPRKIILFLTHTHWDHIQGFPFFVPAYIPGFELEIYGSRGFKKDLRSVFSGQLDSAYFPVQFEDMRAKINFYTLPDEPITIGSFRISWEYTHHPATTLAYRVETNGKSLAWVSDNEFLYGYLGAPHGITAESEVLGSHRPLVDFLTDVDVLIHEAQYTNEEYKTKIGWGHSSISNACLAAHLTRAKRWIVTHHDPLHEDDFLDGKLNLTKEVLRTMNSAIEVRHAHDGMVEYL